MRGPGEKIYVELLPKRQGAQAQAVCVQACRHCPAGVNRREAGSTVIEGLPQDMLEALSLLDDYMEGTEQRFRKVMMGGGLIPTSRDDSLGILPITTPPLMVGLTVGAIDKPDDNPGQLMQRVVERLNTLFAEADLDKCASGLSLSTTPQLSFENAFLIDQAALSSFLIIAIVASLKGDIAGVYPGWLTMTMDFNDIPPQQFELLREETHYLFLPTFLRGILAHAMQIVMTGNDQVQVEYDKHSVEFSVFEGNPMVKAHARRLGIRPNHEVDLIARFISGGKPNTDKAELALRDFDPGVYTLMPDGVWVGHNTRNIADRTVRFGYRDFNEMVNEALKAEGGLVEIVRRSVEARRANM